MKPRKPTRREAPPHERALMQARAVLDGAKASAQWIEVQYRVSRATAKRDMANLRRYGFSGGAG